MSFVLPGVDDVFASLFLPVSILIRDDFPTLDLPVKAYSGLSDPGPSWYLELLLINVADFICIRQSYANPLRNPDRVLFLVSSYAVLLRTNKKGTVRAILWCV